MPTAAVQEFVKVEMKDDPELVEVKNEPVDLDLLWKNGPILKPSQKPNRNTWYTVEFQTMVDDEGNMFITFRNNRFFLKSTLSDGSKCWTCFMQNCSFQVQTRGTNQLKVPDTNHYKHVSYEVFKNRSLDHPVHRLAENEVPRLSTWYSTTELQFFTNQTGRKLMRFRNFEYFCYNETKSRFSSKFSCKCRVSKCSARATTDGQNKIRFGTRDHRHPKEKKVNSNKSTLLKVSQHTNFNARKKQSNITDHPVQRLAENEVPKPSIWYSTTELQFFTNQAGRKWVRFRNFEYTCYDANDRVGTFKIKCTCSVIRCKATATIDGQNNIRFSHRPHRHRKTEIVPDIWTATTLDVAPTQEEVCIQVKNEPVDLELL